VLPAISASGRSPTPSALPTVFAERMRERYGWNVDPERVDVLTDVVQGMYVSIETLSEPGDSVVIPVPIYPQYFDAVRETGRKRIDWNMVRGRDRYELDFDALLASLDDRTRLLMLANPHNPTGRAFTRAELERIAEIAIERDLIVISDEIFLDLVYPGSKHIPIASLGPEIEARTITLTSATKTFSIAGLRCAVAAFGSESLQKSFNRIPRHVRGGVGIMGLEATRIAWQECGPWFEQALAYLTANRNHVADFVGKRWPEVKHLPPESTYLAWLDFSALELPSGPQRFFLREAKVALSYGPAFGPAYGGFARLNFATSRAILDKVLEQMDRALRSRD